MENVEDVKIFVADCKKCGAKYVKFGKQPKDRECSCGTLVKYIEKKLTESGEWYGTIG